MSAAIEQLTNHQQQLDQDGIMVGVSRQAVDEVLAALAARDAEIAWLREALAFYAKDHKRPNEGPWGVNSRDFGDIARAALKASHDDPSDTQGGE